MFVELTNVADGQKMLLNSDSIQTVRKDSAVSTMISTYNALFKVTESYETVRDMLGVRNEKNICGFISEENDKIFKTDFT